MKKSTKSKMLMLSSIVIINILIIFAVIDYPKSLFFKMALYMFLITHIFIAYAYFRQSKSYKLQEILEEAERNYQVEYNMVQELSKYGKKK